MSASEVNAAIKRLSQSNLLRQKLIKATAVQTPHGLTYLPVVKACEEFLIYGVKYVFPAQLGEYTRGIATSYAAPIFAKKINIGNDPVPVWPYAEGTQQGLALPPLYPSIANSIMKYPDQNFYDLLALLDAIRQGRAREKTLAIKLLNDRLKYAI